jgi:hypothetical protein
VPEDLLLGPLGGNPSFMCNLIALFSSGADLSKQEALVLARRSVLAAAANIYWRCQYPTTQVPLCLLAVSDPQMEEAAWIQAMLIVT